MVLTKKNVNILVILRLFLSFFIHFCGNPFKFAKTPTPKKISKCAT